jgi:hypothetical protein
MQERRHHTTKPGMRQTALQKKAGNRVGMACRRPMAITARPKQQGPLSRALSESR